MKKLIVFLIFTVSYASLSGSPDIDWENMIIKATATNQKTAQSIIKKGLYSLQYDDTKTVEQYLKDSMYIENLLNNELSEQIILRQNYLTDGSTEYSAELSLIGKILALLRPQRKKVKLIVPMLCPCCGQEWPAGKPVPEGLKLIPEQIEFTNYTGLVIDCRDLNIKPALFPKIYTEAKEVVYSSNFADPEFLSNNGLVLYTTKNLHNHPRIGSNPLYIKALAASGKDYTNIIISPSDARRIHGSMNNVELLKQCRVVIIITP